MNVALAESERGCGAVHKAQEQVASGIAFRLAPGVACRGVSGLLPSAILVRLPLRLLLEIGGDGLGASALPT